ncbi:MAG: chromosome segregation protein SMC [Lachnospiraceae bacterium]|nr:chromosome segregation protein SMC [Lachnospiraceae bacterium]
MSYAFVSLTIDNSDRSLPLDYDEVVVSRQVFRSGESEYRLNGNICRLRDIYETFYDSGIGKEGYSIIGQGQIEMVLSNKPEERRLMFDEAAGIVRYKKRRDITQKKLDSERISRERIEDIVKELEKQVGPLEKQSAKAKTYLKLRDELKEYEVGVFALEADALETKLEETRNNQETVSNDLEAVTVQLDQLKARYDSLSDENDALDKNLVQIQGQLADLRVANENREGRIGMLSEQIKAAETNSDLLDERVKEYDAAIARSEEEREGYYKSKNETDRLLDQTDDKISGLEEEEESLNETIRDLEYQIEQGNKAMMSSLDRKAEVSSSLAALQAREEQNALRLEALQKEQQAGEAYQSALQQEFDALSESLGQAQKEESLLKSSLKDARDRSASLSAECRKNEEELHRLQRELSAERARKENLRNLIERYDGFGGSVKAIMDVKDRFPGICGVAADLISTEKKYETAIETVLAGRAQNIVTETEEEAKRIIGYLKEKKLGRATFLPLDAVRGDRGLARPEAAREAGALGTAASLVKNDSRYDAVVRFLLGQTLVVDHMDHALAIARKYDHRLSIVTLEGEYLTPGGVISGGAYRNSSNLLGRRREFAESEQAEKKLAAAAGKAEKTADSQRKEIEGLEKKIRQDDIKLRDLQLKCAALKAQNAGRQEELKRGSERADARTKEIARLEEEKKHFGEQRLSFRSNVSELDQGSETLRNEVMELAVKLDRIKADSQDKSKTLEELRVRFANLQQRGDFLLDSIRRCNDEIDRIRNDRQELLKGQVSVEDVVKERETEIEQLKEDILAVKETISALEMRYEEDELLREEKRAEQQTCFEAREALSLRQNELDKENFRLQSAGQRLEEQIEKQAEYLWNEYEMTPSQAKAIRNPEIRNPAEVRRNIAQKKKEIKELGPVYVEAIEKYKEVSERYEFLRGQRDDLVKAESELTSLIRDLEKGMREQFKAQFVLIRDEFAKVFSDLFAGGKGTISLENEEDVLSSGVIINAQPPGKKLQNMMQLSGGEKALTAIALLFAIQNLKPSPFCLLDEIETALDEPNVKRFADYLYRLRGTTQFLIITHRRGTMEMADRLYGITMQEKGVSALVSVSLTDPGSRKILDEQ